MNWNVLKSIFMRDFVSYFSSTTGYVFICVFVVLSALATFWPPEFFAMNLANLDQLSTWLPFIMLVFIPAITMSIWAEEQRQGTDELLLTAPASDLDVVLGKYLAGVAIFTVSLMFSAFSIFLMFKWGLGNPDPGLFISTYIGYWFIGAAMISIGMVASFLTDNLTVGFILGTLFNLPLALFGISDSFIKNPAIASFIRRWSAAEQFRDFERGVVSLGGTTYFVMLSIVMLYVCMVLIGRRHWQARDEGSPLLAHFLIRTVALMALAFGLTEFVQSRNILRKDISSEQLNTLSPDTVKLLKELRENEEAYTIKIEAFVSPQVPTQFSATKLTLLSKLAELQALSGGKVQVTKNEIETYGPEAIRAENTYGITPQEVMVTSGAERSQEEFFMGVAFTSGPAKVVIPFFDRGLPVEYELVRSIYTVLKAERKRVGVVDTGVPYVLPSNDRTREWPLISELRKQYDVEDRPVDPSQPITDNYDVLLVVQPSMLGPQEMDHLVDAVRRGVPVAIFEDPFPHYYPESVAGTGQPKRSQMSMFGGAPPERKGDIGQLWKTLGIRLDPMAVVWQDYRRDISVQAEADDQWVFIDDGTDAKEPFNEEDPISSGLNQLLFLYPGYITPDNDSDLEFAPLAVTGSERSGTVDIPMLRRGDRNTRVFNRQITKNDYVVAARIKGKYVDEDSGLSGNLLEGLMNTGSVSTNVEDATAVEEEEEEEESSEETTEVEDADAEDSKDEEKVEKEEDGVELNAVIVSDMDWILPGFFVLRQRGDESFLPATQNVTFILNIIDSLAGDDRFLEIRKRAPQHRTLIKIDEATRKYYKQALEDRNKSIEKAETKLQEAQKRYRERIEEIENDPSLTPQERRVQVELAERQFMRKLQSETESYEAERNREIKQADYKLKQEIQGVEDQYKMFALLVPPIPPLLVAFYVFFRRREAEREGVAQSRLR